MLPYARKLSAKQRRILFIRALIRLIRNPKQELERFEAVKFALSGRRSYSCFNETKKWSEKCQKILVSLDGYNLKFIEKPTKQVLKLAVRGVFNDWSETYMHIQDLDDLYGETIVTDDIWRVALRKNPSYILYKSDPISSELQKLVISNSYAYMRYLPSLCPEIIPIIISGIKTDSIAEKRIYE